MTTACNNYEHCRTATANTRCEHCNEFEDKHPNYIPQEGDTKEVPEGYDAFILGEWRPFSRAWDPNTPSFFAQGVYAMRDAAKAEIQSTGKALSGVVVGRVAARVLNGK